MSVVTGGREAPRLPADVVVLERGWLSSNNVLLLADDECALVDSGYVTHAEQTLALVEHARGGRPLRRLLNTHLHSDHCGGNAALQAAYPELRTFIPERSWAAVQSWDEDRLSYRATGQVCAQFRANGMLRAGDVLRIGAREWSVEAAPGHDPDSVMLFDHHDGLLISADALWERGFGVVFPELDGDDAFSAVAATLDRIGALKPRLVIPGHGAPFGDVATALAYARRRLADFVCDPERHAAHAAKVLIKFKLLEWQQIGIDAAFAWADRTPCLHSIHARHFSHRDWRTWIDELLASLERSGVLLQDGAQLSNR